jgi:hypothetical protein
MLRWPPQAALEAIRDGSPAAPEFFRLFSGKETAAPAVFKPNPG